MPFLSAPLMADGSTIFIVVGASVGGCGFVVSSPHSLSGSNEVREEVYLQKARE